MVRRAPDIIAASSQLLDKRRVPPGERSRVPPDEADEKDLERRIVNLEDSDAEHARVVAQLAKQAEDLSVGLSVLAARLRLLTWVVAAALLAGIGAFWYAL